MKDKKQIALELLSPYYKDNSLCGYEDGNCVYSTSDGKNCVAGKCMIDPQSWENINIDSLLLYDSQEDVFQEEYVDVFTDKEWDFLQHIHDCIATNDGEDRDFKIENLIVNKSIQMFTLAELQNFS